MKISDSLDRQQNSFNLSGHYNDRNAKHAMQNLYKQQLDSLMNQRNRQKQVQKNREIAEKKEFNERAINNKESQRIKEQAYKNYYNMLLNNQEQLQSSYVNPFSVRDTMKDQHIINSVEEGQQKLRQWEIQEKRRQAERKNMYRSQLMNQIQQRRKMENLNKQQQQRKKEQFRKYGKLPDEISKYERQKHMEEMNKYRQDLDKVKNDKEYFRTRTMSEQQSMKIPSDQHNTLINPLPYNIQNPYILKEMNRQSYLASRGNQNFNNPHQ